MILIRDKPASYTAYGHEKPSSSLPQIAQFVVLFVKLLYKRQLKGMHNKSMAAFHGFSGVSFTKQTKLHRGAIFHSKDIQPATTLRDETPSTFATY